MRFVQALYWVRDMLPSDDGSIHNRLINILRDPDHGPALENDLRDAFRALTDWMQPLARELLEKANASPKPYSSGKAPSHRAPKSTPYHEKKEASPTK
jgi:hypothetical protein